MILGAPVRHLFMHGVVWFLDRNPCKVLEIGSYEGASALTWHESGCEVFCVDPWLNYDTAPKGIKTAYKNFLENTKGTSIKHVKISSDLYLP